MSAFLDKRLVLEYAGVADNAAAFTEHGGTGLTSATYALVPGDIRDFASLTQALTSPPPSDQTGPPLLDRSLPTLLLAECVLVYLPPETTIGVLAWFRQTFASGAAVSYDPFGLQDNFGKVMIRNLAVRCQPAGSV